MDRAFERTKILTDHLLQSSPPSPVQTSLSSNACFNYTPPELSEKYAFDTKEMRRLIDGHHLEVRDRLFGMMSQSKLFNPRHMNKPCPVIPSQLTSTALRSSQFQMKALCLRERDLLNRFAAEISHYQAKGLSKEHAFNMSYQIAEDLGRAFTDRSIFQAFAEAEATLAASSLKDVLGMVRSLYGLICVEDASFLRYGYLSVENAAAVRSEITKVCGELRPHALALVSSFGIPHAFLSPIAFNWIDANSWSSIQQ
ncbi:putative acyl-coenzyme A oxidase At3g06690 isoform X2 [Gossypium arboreum]|uniref:putative acyl-coenzyme A oxidase At3g06690 isoform X2 n=1 Tax=Gossypium arboreum TaxID=29729 RepID=UPI0022F1A89B|nr:putative acyl-coenzyme A oxidase At3g06690 isoform X2 [Gossypium arboreum]